AVVPEGAQAVRRLQRACAAHRVLDVHAVQHLGVDRAGPGRRPDRDGVDRQHRVELRLLARPARWSLRPRGAHPDAGRDRAPPPRPGQVRLVHPARPHPDRRRDHRPGVHVPRGHAWCEPLRPGPQAGRHGRRLPPGWLPAAAGLPPAAGLPAGPAAAGLPGPAPDAPGL
ncbi:MAG: Integral membrane protein, partial [uncultured Actinomycetospora sp.]